MCTIVKTEEGSIVVEVEREGKRVRIPTPPSVKVEDIPKLHRTAELLLELGKMWTIPDVGLDNEMVDGMLKSEDETLGECRLKNFLLDQYQQAPFIPVFFNRNYYKVIQGHIIELLAEERADSNE